MVRIGGLTAPKSPTYIALDNSLYKQCGAEKDGSLQKLTRSTKVNLLLVLFAVFASTLIISALIAGLYCRVDYLNFRGRHQDVIPVEVLIDESEGLPGTHIRPPEVSHSNGFKEASRYLSKLVDTSVDPCDNFYKYSCGNFVKNNMSNAFVAVQGKADVDIFKQLKSTDNTDLKALQTTKTVYDICSSVDYTKYAGKEVLDIVRSFKRASGLNFPFIDKRWHETADPKFTPVQLGSTLALMKSVFGIDSILEFDVDTNWAEPTGKQPYLMFIGEASLSLPTVFYRNGHFDKQKGNVEKTMRNVLTKIAQVAKVQVDQKTIEDTIKDMLEVEKALGKLMRLPEETRTVSEEWNQFTIAQAKARWSFVDFASYFRFVAIDNPKVQKLVQSATFKFVVSSPKYLDGIEKLIKEDGISDYGLRNYLMFRLIAQKAKFLGESQLQAGDDATPADKVNHGCVGYLRSKLPYAVGRSYVDSKPRAERESIEKKLMRMANYIGTAFQTMIDELPWMTREDKRRATEKIYQLVKTVGAPEWILNDEKFSAYYKELTVDAKDDYFNVQLKLDRFNHGKSLEFLLRDKVDRTDFSSISPATVNAWYQAHLNSISFPLATLQAPFFDTEWPLSLSFGGMGSTMGHELSHGFDDGGMQWDPTGTFKSWISSNKTKSGFERMRVCVVNQYEKVCPYGESKSCVNGKMTQGENIADNAGVRAAFRAYKSLVALDGPEPRLPGDLISQYNHDQLFFLGYAGVWCKAEQTEDQFSKQVIIDVHSPDRERVLESLKNFAAFQDAFNCPATTTMSPKRRCNVWAGDN
uniref:Peptidase_M13 domain-containing protein n=1 Tax=Steinernema glaseri TaxID=37863 RepID=A0A1I8AIN3_9BILA